MREHKNILVYGFLIFLFFVGIISIFYHDLNFINATNTLAIPVFLFTISTLIAKANHFMRKVIMKEVSNKEKTDERIDALLNKAKENAKKINHTLEDEKIAGETRNEAAKSKLYLTALYKRFIILDRFTICINVIAMLSFVLCLMSLIGVFSIDASFHWINIFSLALVFFDFFVLDEWLNGYSEKLKKKTDKIAEEDLNKLLKENDK